MAKPSVNIWISNSSGTSMPFDVTPYLQSLEFSTEIWKGYSSCSFTITHAKISGLSLSSINGKCQILIFVGGDLCWKGRVESLQSSTTEITITGIGGYSFLEDYTYDDGAFRYPIIHEYYNDDFGAEGSGGDLQLSAVSNRWGIAVRCSNDLSFNTTMLSFMLRLYKYRDEAAPDGTAELAGYMQPFFATDLNDEDTFVYYDNIDVSALSSDGYESFEFRASIPTLIPESSVFYVGFKADNDEYIATANTYTHIRVNAQDNHLTTHEENAWGYDYEVLPSWFLLGVGNERTFSVQVISDGKWNYTPGPNQEDVIQDVISEYNRKFGLDLNQRLRFIASPYENNLIELPYFQLREPVTGLSAIQEILHLGINRSGNYFPVYCYVYSNSTYGNGYNLIIKPVDFSEDAKGLVWNSDSNRTIDINFAEMYTQVKVYFDNPDGLKEETTAYYTFNPYITPREKYVTASGIDMGEADIIAELHADLENNFKNQRSITVKFEEVYGAVGLSPIAAWRLKAGDYIYVPSPTNTNFPTQKAPNIIKFFISGTTCNPLDGEITLDLGFETDKERLLEILGAN